MPFCRGTPQDNLARAVKVLEEFGAVTARSRLFSSPAWPNPADPPFVNAAVAMETELSPDALLAALHSIEAAFGRRRLKKYGPRTLDLDILDYHGQVRVPNAAASLALPHPAVAERDFVLLPLADIAPQWTHPVTGESVADLIARLARITAEPIAGSRGGD